MAEDEERRDGSKRSQRRDPARAVRRDLPVIEGEAREITPDSDPVSHPATPADAPDRPVEPDPTPAASDALSEPSVGSPAEPVESPPPATEPYVAETTPRAETVAEPERRDTRSPWGAAIIVGFVVLAAAVLYLFSQMSALPPDMSASVADLKGRVAALESHPDANAAGLGERLTKVERGLGESQARIDGLGKRVDGITAALASQPNAAGQVADLQTAVTSLKSDLAGVKSSVAALPRPDIGRIETRLTELDQKLSGLQGAVSGIPHVDLGPLTGKVDAIETRLKPIEAEANAAQSPEQVAQRRAAPVAVTAQAVSDAIAAGQAFPKELQALEALGVDPAKLASLRAVADGGAPTTQDLQGSLAEVRDRIVSQGTVPATGSYMDRLVAGASGLVQVRPLGSVVGDTPAAIVARMNDDIGRDDLSAALGEWHKLPEASQTASKALADRIKLRLNAEQAARTIAADAIGAMARPRG